MTIAKFIIIEEIMIKIIIILKVIIYLNNWLKPLKTS